MLRVKNCKFYACGGGVNLRKGKEKGKYKYNNFHFYHRHHYPVVLLLCAYEIVLWNIVDANGEDDDIMKKVVSLVGSTCSLCL